MHHHTAALASLLLLVAKASGCPFLFPDEITSSVMQYNLAPGTFEYIHVDGCGGTAGCSKIIYSIKSNSASDDDASAPAINVYGFNRANLMSFATAGTTTGSITGYTQTNTQCTDVTDVIGEVRSDDELEVTGATFTGGDALYLVIECPSSGNSCEVEAGIRWISSSTAGQCSTPKELDSTADNVRNTVVSPGAKWVSPAIKPCGASGCTNLEYSLTSWGIGAFDFVALDETNKALFESGQTYTALDVNGLKSQTDVICASGKGITTPASINKVYLGVACRSVVATEPCALSFFLQFTGDSSVNDDSADDYPVGDDDTIGKECENAITASGVTLDSYTIAAGKFHILPMDSCGTSGCTDVKIAAQSTDTSDISLYAMDLYDLIGLMSGGDFSFDQAEVEVECGYKDGFSSSTIAGSHYFMIVQCVTGKSAGGACKVDAGFSRVAGTGSNNDDDSAASCVDPASNFAAAEVKSQTITSGGYHSITVNGCGGDLGKCTNVKWAVKSTSDSFAVMGINALGYSDVTGGLWNQVRAEEVFVPWTSCHGDISGTLSVGQDLDEFYFIIVCLDNDGTSCDVSYALTYDAYAEPSPTSQPTDDTMFDDNGDWSDCVDPSAIGTQSSTTLIEDAWDADTVLVTGCSAALGCRDIKYSVKTTDGSEIHVYGLTGAEAAKIRSTGSSDGVTSLFEAHRQDCVSDDSGTRNGPTGQTSFVLAIYCYKPAADGFCAMDYIIEATLPTPTPTPSGSTGPSPTSSPSTSGSPTNAPPSESPGASSSSTGTPSPTPSPSTSPSRPPTPTPTPSISMSANATPSASSGQTVTATPTPSTSPSASITPSPTVTPSASITPSSSPSGSVSPGPSQTPTPTRSVGASASPSPSISMSATSTITPTGTRAPSISASPSVSGSPTSSAPPSATPTQRHCPDTAAVFPGAAPVTLRLSKDGLARMSLGRDVSCTSSSQCTGTRYIVENVAEAGLPKAFFDVYGMSMEDYKAVIAGTKELADVTVYQPFQYQAVTCIWQDIGLVTPVLASSSSSARQLLSGAPVRDTGVLPMWSRHLTDSSAEEDGDDADEFVLTIFCRTPDANSGQCNLRYVAQAVPAYDPDAPPSPTPTPAPSGEQPCPLSPAAVTSLSDDSHPDTVGGTTTKHESSAPALLTAQAGTFVVVDLIGCDTTAGCTDLAVAVRLANAKPAAGGTTVETGRRFTIAGMTGVQLSQFLTTAASSAWDRTIPQSQAVEWRSDDLTRCFPPAPASRRAAALLGYALYGAAPSVPSTDAQVVSSSRPALRLSKGQRLWMPAGDGLAIDNDATGAGWLSSSDTSVVKHQSSDSAEIVADISTPMARRALAAGAGMPDGTTTTPAGETFHIVMACEPDAAGAGSPDFCSMEYAVAYERSRQSVAPGGRVDTGSVADDDLVLEQPDAGSGSGAGYGSSSPGDACGADGECSTFACRGGFCCNAAALEDDTDPASSACAVCVAGDGSCGLRAGEAISACPLTCEDEGAKLACGARSDGSFFCGQMYNTTGGSVGIAGHCMCGSNAVSWTTIGVDPIYGVPTSIDCASTALNVCPAIVAAAVRRTDDAKAAAQANPAGGNPTPPKIDDGTGLAVGLGFVGVIALVAAGWFGVTYVRRNRPDWAVERGFVPAFSDADIEQRARRVSRLGRRTRWEVHGSSTPDKPPLKVDTPSEPENTPLDEPVTSDVASSSPTVNPLAALAPDLSRRSQRVLLTGTGRGV